VTYSALTGTGIAPLWEKVLEHHQAMDEAGELAARRRQQQVKWMWAMLEERILGKLHSDPALRARLPRLEAAVAEGRMAASLAVEELAVALGI
jgi:LAO/AO transport system kinase